MEPARNHRNPRVVEAARLHRGRARGETGLTLIEGPNLLTEYVGGGLDPEVVFALDGDGPTQDLCIARDIEMVTVDDRALARLAGTKTPRGPVSVIRIPDDHMLGDASVLVAWGVADPGNVGSMIRTAAAFGWGFAYSEGTADPWSPKVLRAGAGGHFRCGISRLTTIHALDGLGFTIVASVVAGGTDPRDLEPGRFAVVVGEEAHGLPGPVVDGADQIVTIPMPGGSESLNASIAAALLIYQFTDSA
jgi:TrmH family RNA methyltransferase